MITFFMIMISAYSKWLWLWLWLWYRHTAKDRTI